MPESPATDALVEQWGMLHVQDGVLQKDMEEAAREHTWLRINLFFLQGELLEGAHACVSSGHLGRRKALRHQCRCLCWVSMGHEVEWSELYHFYVA